MYHENFYEVAAINFAASAKALTSSQANPVMENLIEGLRHLALGLLQDGKEKESQLAEISKLLRPQI